MPANEPEYTEPQRLAELHRLAEALALAERDRQLLSYEIHDGVVQDLSAAALYLEGASREANFSSTQAQERFTTGLRLLRDGIGEMRRLLRGAVIVELDEQGLSAVLARLAERFRQDHALPVDFSSSADSVALPPSVQHLLLRIAQEALYNIAKHAQAKQAQLRLLADVQQLELSISDDGQGFDPAQVPPGHLGLEGIRARARVLGADLKIDSGAGQGTRIRVTMPLGEWEA